MFAAGGMFAGGVAPTLVAAWDVVNRIVYAYQIGARIYSFAINWANEWLLENAGVDQKERVWWVSSGHASMCPPSELSLAFWGYLYSSSAPSLAVLTQGACHTHTPCCRAEKFRQRFPERAKLPPPTYLGTYTLDQDHLAMAQLASAAYLDRKELTATLGASAWELVRVRDACCILRQCVECELFVELISSLFVTPNNSYWLNSQDHLCLRPSTAASGQHYLPTYHMLYSYKDETIYVTIRGTWDLTDLRCDVDAGPGKCFF